MAGKDKTKGRPKNKLKKNSQDNAELKEMLKECKVLKQDGQERNNLYCSIIDSTDDSIYLVDKDYQYIFVNKKHMSRMGLLNGQLIKRAYSEFHSKNESIIFSNKVDAVFLSGKPEQHEYKSERDGKYFLQTFSPMNDSDGNIIAVNVISKNITRLKEVEEKLRALSFTDELTGLYNRRGFFALAEQQIKLAGRDNRERFLISADFDNLKAINDNMGHNTGDMALIETSVVLKESFRDTDIIARIGGDEFAVLLIGNSPVKMDKIINRLRSNMNLNNNRKKREYKLSLSIGSVLYNPEKPNLVDGLLSMADKLMYEEKKQKQKNHLGPY
jgi:diguanylate cyclase (GGDEF)-like protein/PAS domain S-box-containing protein